jgi:L-lactate utilization protein LutB
MGVFGTANIILGLGQKNIKNVSIEELTLPITNRTRELYLIILDNGRSQMLESKYRDLFLCIGCRACNKHCPISHAMLGTDHIWTPRNYLYQFVYGTGGSLDKCLHCESCRIECPININLPLLMWQAKMDYLSKNNRSISHRLLGSPELLAKGGTLLSPIANALINLSPFRVIMEIVSGIDKRTLLPTFHSETFRGWFNRYGREFST